MGCSSGSPTLPGYAVFFNSISFGDTQAELQAHYHEAVIDELGVAAKPLRIFGMSLNLLSVFTTNCLILTE
ncbi:hypothetical protein N7533_004997 [Penicillium manginii]|uniref:uncharacterized protein n=1 Tax=Penicillium manginii TaxID=203109 RepID=UPI0025486ACC|nr:uncharacterized protein N7533_004997 [Penicillium manginii]KAJ5755454.1 hypothetical protein N7533_004997 [Penicillium manginii]